jgi:hypothetical protein
MIEPNRLNVVWHWTWSSEPCELESRPRVCSRMALSGWEVNPNLVLLRRVSESRASRYVALCLHWCDDEGVQRDLVQDPVVTGSSEQVLTELLGNSVTEHTVT